MGDAWDRYVCRMQEIEESLKIVEQAVQQFPKDGAVLAKVPKLLRHLREKHLYVSNRRAERLGVISLVTERKSRTV